MKNIVILATLAALTVGFSSCSPGGRALTGGLMAADYSRAKDEAYQKGFSHGRNDRNKAKPFNPQLRQSSVRDTLQDEYRRGYRIGFGRR